MSEKDKLRKCKTIDEFIHEYSIWRDEGYDTYSTTNIYADVIRYNQHFILSILKLETNKPSVHDLSLITTIHEVRHTFKILVNSTWIQETNEILEIYKDRK